MARAERRIRRHSRSSRSRIGQRQATARRTEYHAGLAANPFRPERPAPLGKLVTTAAEEKPPSRQLLSSMARGRRPTCGNPLAR